MVGVQDEDAIHGALDHGIDDIVFARRAKHHAQEVARVAQLVARVHIGLALAVFVGHGDQRRHFGNQADGRNFAVAGVLDVSRVVVEGRHGAGQPDQHRHGVRIAAEAAHEKVHLLVHHGMAQHHLVKVFALLRIGQLTLDQQVTHIQKIAMLGQLLDGVAAVQQLALVAIDVGDGGLARGCGQEARIIGEHAGFTIELANVDHVRSDGAAIHRQLHTGCTIAEGQVGNGFCGFHGQYS